MSDNPSLSPRRRRSGSRSERSDTEIAAAVERMIRALGRRCASDDPPSVKHLVGLRNAVDDAFAAAVAGWRSVGFSDAAIGAELGITKQAVQQRWPR